MLENVIDKVDLCSQNDCGTSKLAPKMQEKNRKKFTKRQKIALAIITVIDLMSFCSVSLMSLFLPEQISKKGEYIEFFCFSMKFSVFITLSTSLLFGIIVPKLGVKNMFLGAVIISRLATTLFGTLYYVHDITIFTFLSFFLRAIETMGACIYFISGYVIIFSTFPEEVGVIRGLLESVVEIGTTIGPAIGELFFTIGGYGLPFYFVGTFTIILAIGGKYALDDVKDRTKSRKSMTTFIKIPMVTLTCCVIITISTTINSLDPTLGEYLTTNLLLFRQSGYVYLFISVAFALSSPVWSYITEKTVKFEWMMPVGLYLTSMSLICLKTSFLETVYIKLLAISVLGISLAMSSVPTFRCLTIGAFEEGFENTVSTHSYVISTWIFMFSIGEILGTSLGLILYTTYDFMTVSIVIATINASMGAICSIFLFFRRSFCTFNVTIQFE